MNGGNNNNNNNTFHFQISSYEICPIRWFLVKTNQELGLPSNKYRYYILHMSDLIDGNFHDIYVNRSVDFKLNDRTISGNVLEASNRMLCLVDRMLQVTNNATDIYESTDALMHRLNVSLREINTMASSLRRVGNLVDSIEQKNYFKQLISQLEHDGDELSETKAFFNSLNLICLKTHYLIETNKSLPVKEIVEVLHQYLTDVLAAAGDVRHYQILFHPPDCVCNVFQQSGKLEEIVSRHLAAENEVVDR